MTEPTLEQRIARLEFALRELQAIQNPTSELVIPEPTLEQRMTMLEIGVSELQYR